jgi:hypothetical protein
MCSSSFWFTVALVVVVVARFLFRELRVRRIRKSNIFMVPGVMAVLGVFLVYSVISSFPDQIFNLLIGGIIAIVVGGAIGFAVGHFTTVQVQQSGLLIVRGSWITVAIWIAALALRLFAKYLVGGGPSVACPDVSALGPSMMLNAVLVILLIAALTTVRLRILATARSETPGETKSAV